ncbi:MULTISPECIES: aldehyde dehydrogenase family protein [Nocardioides]|uniref:Aldehyde dehydrogenase family protein n=1 Tax=Nocardioides vastitatis TaxID=2568655 RepID=A0ABW0ZHS8_9ACTN|nr:aldehyde dehydrogenase family protein [Nocardioides sp.]THJ05784.1 aldehyde dehydrogenase family protein [Nocardioides sp.]
MSVTTDDSVRFEVRAPADGRILDLVREDGPGEVAAAVNRLRKAQPTWAALPIGERIAWLGRFRDWIYANESRLSALLAAETGKPAAEVGIELTSSLGVLRYYSRHAHRFLADGNPRPSSLLTALKRMRVRRVPQEVVGVISPWNFPVAMCLWDAFPALLAGSSVILKPSEHTPLTTNALVQGWAEVGAPQVLAVVNGAAATGTAVVDRVDHVHFTGSTRTGRSIATRAADRLIPYSLELGGNDPALVLADADLDLAASGIVFNGLLNSGQMCVSVERVYVVAEVHDEFVARVLDRVRALRTEGDGFDRDITTLITPDQHDVVRDQVADALSRGAHALIGGEPGEGRHYPPTVLVNVDHSMRVMAEETFGPVLPIMRVANVDEAVRLANDSPYGLSASVWSRDRAAAERVAERLEAGTVDINDAATHILCHPIPQSGWKQSGVGARLGGAHGLQKYTRTQAITANRVDLPLVTALAGFPYSASKSRLLDRIGRLNDGGRLARRVGLDSDRTFEVTARRTIHAPAIDVHAWLLDSSNYAKALPGVIERRIRDGANEPYGVGTVRDIISPAAFLREEITAVTPTTISYVITRSFPPLAHERATITVTPLGPTTCNVVWTSRLSGARVAEKLLGTALGAVFGRILRECATDLVGGAR